MVLSNNTADYEKMAQKVLDLLNAVPRNDSILMGDICSEKEQKEDEQAQYKNYLKSEVRDGLDQALKALSSLSVIKKKEGV